MAEKLKLGSQEADGVTAIYCLTAVRMMRLFAFVLLSWLALEHQTTLLDLTIRGVGTVRDSFRTSPPVPLRSATRGDGG